MIKIRPATPEDAQSMCNIINPLVAEGTTTAQAVPFTPDMMVEKVISYAGLVSCVVAVVDGQILGYQYLKHLSEHSAAHNEDKTNWGDIASFVDHKAQGLGLGQRLFAQTKSLAQSAGIATINATIRTDNVPGLAYYSGLGFIDHGQTDGVTLADGRIVSQVHKRFEV